MKFIQKIIPLFKKKYVWIPLLTVSIILQLIGIAALIGICSYQLKPKDMTFGPWQYSYELSEKAALDTWEKNTQFMKNDPLRTRDRVFGEFRVWVELSKDESGKEKVNTLFTDGEYAKGLLYINGSKYSARLYPQTGDVTYEQVDVSGRLGNWHWYNWMGLRAPQGYLSFTQFLFEK